MGTKSRTLSITSTILLTIYTVCLVLAEAGMFAICKFAVHMTNAGIGLASDSIAAGGCVIDYATPGTVAGGMLAGLGGTAWIVLTSFMVFLFIICTVYIAITAISYALVKKGYYKADAWMKITIFGVTFLGFIIGANLSCLQMLCMTIILVLPIILSIMVLFNEKPCATCKKVSEERKNETEPKSDFKQQEQEDMSEKVAEERKPDDMTNKAADAAGEESTQADEPSEEKAE